MSNYETLTAKIEAFSTARSSYWQDLEDVLEPLIPKFREYLGVTNSSWTSSSGSEYPYVTLGATEGNEFVECRISDLEPTENYQLVFMLKFNLQVGQHPHLFEQVYLPMTLERKDGDYLFGIDGCGDIGHTQAILKEINYRTGNWAGFFDVVTARIAKEFEIGRFA